MKIHVINTLDYFILALLGHGGHLFIAITLGT